nr:immunoglobulin heavy chain junction region [Macaca mulatta]MOW76537.1 immunoglobulin heavy chain junction region [Macaca mulatta]MOW76913.1 immunoglobulin heavy chain junction region [Macaca mulatta]MOW77040.1 immunoglobulin heavy chain junction region [Macaca mulatta]MOW77529.1 immunoglobulin heavy chain junction region [Macaca mulatta]
CAREGPIMVELDYW